MRDEFELSVEMSTYLVCFVVCDFAHVSNRTNSNVTVSVYAPAPIIDQADYALHSAITLLEYYEQFFTVPYPLPKLGNQVVWRKQRTLAILKTWYSDVPFVPALSVCKPGYSGPLAPRSSLVK